MSNNIAIIIDQAFERGYKRGYGEYADDAPKNDFPLSGEWADESMSELIGDLLALTTDDEHGHEICMAYEDGYSEGYDMACVHEVMKLN
jgi:hypothetical protein